MLDESDVPEWFEALHEALHDRDIKHPAKRETWRCEEDFNWLDAAPFDFLVEMTDPILLFCARKMVIRASALQEMAFSRTGYSGSKHVERGIVPQDIKYYVEKNRSFYQRLKGRLAKLGHLDSINRRAMVLHFPGANAAPLSTGNPPSAAAAPDETLYDIYEKMRRSNITDYAAIVYYPMDPSSCRMDFLDNATPQQLDASADAILLASESRMAIRSSVRLDLAWRQEAGDNDRASFHKRPLLHDLIDERDYHVDVYLKVLEEDAKAEHLKSIRERSTPSGVRKVRRPRMRVKKASGA